MSNELPDVRQELIALIGRIVGPGPLPPDLQRTLLELVKALMPAPGEQGMVPSVSPGGPMAAAPSMLAGVATAGAAVAGRKLIYVHGICRHTAGFSNPWWDSLHPFEPTTFGPGTLGQTRLEVVWSDIVNQASAALAAAAVGPVGAAPAEEKRRRAAGEIKEALRDRIDQHVMAAAMRTDVLAAGPPGAAPETLGLISIPGLNCIDDFSIYLIDDDVRQRILDRFINVVRPELQAGTELDIISHSWGTVVAYEGLRQMEDEGLSPPRIRNLFTVGAALSIGPVKLRLRDANKDGRKPGSVRRWVNLDAHGDIVGGPLKDRPYAADLDFVNLEATGCSSFLGVVNPGCAHGSYFESSNTAVNQGIFARFIDSA